jgi:glycosyltransferase involved in cell wall biosynthesis
MISPVLSVIIPAYNEAATIARVLNSVAAAPFDKQIIVVDDGSNDGTATALESWRRANNADVTVARHPVNRGKGRAIRTGLALARGEVVLVQDADLEYDPSDYPALLGPILDGTAEVVYGSRYLRRDTPRPCTPNRLCVRLLNLIIRACFGGRTTDSATGYKVFRTALLRRMDLRCERFEFCPEVTAKLCRLGLTIHEVPVRYTPRTRLEGKKIGWRDGVEAIATLIRWRIARFRPLDRVQTEETAGYASGRPSDDSRRPASTTCELASIIPDQIL